MYVHGMWEVGEAEWLKTNTLKSMKERPEDLQKVLSVE